MAPQKVMVIRTDDEQKDWLWGEISQGRLRQGWGCSGLQLIEDGNIISYELWSKNYLDVSKNIYKKDITSDEILNKYRIMRNMINLVDDDIVIIPKMPNRDEFTIAKVKGTYFFDLPPNTDDYGHIIPLDQNSIRRCHYMASIESRIVSNKFKGFQCAVNNVWDVEFIEAIRRIFDDKDSHLPRDLKQLFSDIRNPLIDKTLEQIRKLTPNDLEKLTQFAFEQAGYQYLNRNQCDRKGGDADLIFMHHLPLIKNICESGMTVFIQVKQKTGRALDDVQGIDQLASISADKPYSIRILASTADDFSEDCRERAKKEDVILIKGLELADMLIRYL